MYAKSGRTGVLSSAIQYQAYLQFIRFKCLFFFVFFIKFVFVSAACGVCSIFI